MYKSNYEFSPTIKATMRKCWVSRRR